MTGFASIMRGNNFCELRFGHLPSSDLKECAYYSAHHVAQEPIGRDDEVRFGFILLYPLRFADIADRRLDICMHAAERSEVLFAQEQQGGLIHGGKIQAGCNARMRESKERILARGDTIAIGAGYGIKSRMGIVGDVLQSTDGYRIG